MHVKIDKKMVENLMNIADNQMNLINSGKAPINDNILGYISYVFSYVLKKQNLIQKRFQVKINGVFLNHNYHIFLKI